MNRRKFLTGTSALFCAAAIIQAENTMRIWVPPSKLIIGDDLYLCGVFRGELNYKNAVEITYFGTEHHVIAGVQEESVIALRHTLPADINAIPLFKGEVIFSQKRWMALVLRSSFMEAVPAPV